MIFRVYRTSHMLGGYPESVYKKDDEYFINIHTIEELMDFQKAVNEEIVIDEDTWNNKREPFIEIHDDYMD